MAPPPLRPILKKRAGDIFVYNGKKKKTWVILNLRPVFPVCEIFAPWDVYIGGGGEEK